MVKTSAALLAPLTNDEPKGSPSVFNRRLSGHGRCDAAFGLTFCLWCGDLDLTAVHIVGSLPVFAFYLNTIER